MAFIKEESKEFKEKVKSKSNELLQATEMFYDYIKSKDSITKDVIGNLLKECGVKIV